MMSALAVITKQQELCIYLQGTHPVTDNGR